MKTTPMQHDFLILQGEEKIKKRMREDCSYRLHVYRELVRDKDALLALLQRWRTLSNEDDKILIVQAIQNDALRVLENPQIGTFLCQEFEAASAFPLRQAIIQTLAMGGAQVFDAPETEGCLLRASLASEPSIRAWSIAAYANVVNHNRAVRERLAQIAENDASEIVRYEAESALVDTRDIGILPGIMKALHQLTTQKREFLQTLVEDTTSILQTLYIPRQPRIAGSFGTLSGAGSKGGEVDGFHWRLIPKGEHSFLLRVSVERNDVTGQILDIRAPYWGPKQFLSLIMRYDEAFDECSAEAMVYFDLPEDAQFAFFLYDWNTVKEPEWRALREVYLRDVEPNNSPDAPEWEKWLALSAERFRKEAETAESETHEL